jgi:hypothetical protein
MFVGSPCYITIIMVLIDAMIVFYPKELVRLFLGLYLTILWWLSAALWVLLAYLVPCLVEGIKDISLAVWTGSVKYLTTRAAPIFVQGKKRITDLMRINFQLIWLLFSWIIVYLLMVYTMYLASS